MDKAPKQTLESRLEAQQELAGLEGLMTQVRRDPGRFGSVGALAAAAGLGLPALERLFLVHAHRGAEAFLDDARAKAACRLLLASPEPAWEAVRACGFPDQETFRARFLRAAGTTPEAFQSLGRPGEAGFTLALPADYRAEDVLAYHGRDPQSRSERVDGATLVKAMAMDGGAVVLEITFGEDSVRCRALAPASPGPETMGGIHRRVVRMLGLGTDPAPFERFVAGLDLHPLVAPRLGLRIPLTADVWESLVWAVLGQQVNLAFAYSLRRRLTELCGQDTGLGLRAHPAPEAVAALDPDALKPLQFSRSKAEYVVGLARKVADGALPLEALPEGPATSAALRLGSERGVGPWTAHYVLMRGCGFGDCVPLGDAGLTLALQRHYRLDHRPSVKETAAFMAPFAPHRSLATFHLWASLKGVPA
ncbi:MAG: helix-turn-helix domain-containing protein [Holophaga sp.]|jgi:AraC family transcriptional regulator of adaptative response / DNA-3-methyladenine glycosylase II